MVCRLLYVFPRCLLANDLPSLTRLLSCSPASLTSDQTDGLSLGDKWNGSFSLAMRAHRRPTVDVGAGFGPRERSVRPWGHCLGKFAHTRRRWSSLPVIPDGIRRKIRNCVFGRLRQTPRGLEPGLFSSTAVVFRSRFEAAEFNDLLPQEVDCHCTIARSTPWTGQTSLSRCVLSDSAPERESEARTHVAVFLLSCENFL